MTDNSPIILDGTATAKAIRAEVAVEAKQLTEATGVVPVLAAILAGDDPASQKYVEMKAKASAKANIGSRTYPFSRETSQSEVEERLAALNADPSVHGILIQHPLPKHMDEPAVLLQLDPAKDVDGIAPISLGRLAAGLDSFHSCTPAGMIELLKRYHLPIAGKHAVVVGRSVILGKPLALMLLAENATVTVCHSRTPNLGEITRQADILCACVGKPEMITADMIKPGAVVLDAGYNRVEGRSKDVGDVDFEGASRVASAITPVPGGVGPMTIAMLLRNTLTAARRAAEAGKAGGGVTFDLTAYLHARRRWVDDALDAYLPPASQPPARLHESMRYSLFCGGKRLRPILALAGAEAVGGEPHHVLPLACAVECIHTFSLIHDDLPAIDDDDLRRGNPTNHVVYGQAMAILAGDALLALAFELIAECRLYLPAERVLDALAMVARASGTRGMVGGQVSDIECEGRDDLDESTVASIHARKTGALLLASLLAGVRLCGASVAEECALREYGHQIGLAFQITDDILDLEGDADKLGKPLGSDLKQDKATYPKVLGLPASRDLARTASATAVAALAAFGPAADPLRALAGYVVERES